MSDEVDSLFSGVDARPEPRIRMVLGLLFGGLAMAFLGLACSSAPGGLIVLGAWAVAEKEMDRVESGYLPEEVRPRIRSVQQAVLVGLGLVLVMFVVQAWLLSQGVYDILWSGILQVLFGAGEAV